MTWSTLVRVASQNLASHFESLVYNLESISSQIKLSFSPISFLAKIGA